MRDFIGGPVYRTVSANSLLMLFAPKFDGFGRDVARAFSARCDGVHVHGLCTGPREVYKRVADGLADLGGRFWRLEKEEETWLSTPVSTGELERVDRELGPGAFGRIVTADRRIGRGFVRGGLTRPDRIGRWAARDPGVSAQRYVNGLYRFLDSVLRETKPDIVFCYAVAGAPAVALAEICRVRGIPFCLPTYTRIGDGHVIDEDAVGRLPSVARRFERARDEHAPFAPSLLESAREYLEAFRAAPVAPKSMVGSWTSGPSRSAAASAARSALSLLLCCLKEASRGRWPGVHAERELFKAWIAWRRRLAGRAGFASPDQLPREFIYFPLHIDPEASTMVLSPWHTDQLGVVEALAKSAPAHMRIVVKEHSPMLGLRPRGFYRQIAKMPRVMLLDPVHSSFDLIGKAALTAVITGTAVWEAILLGRPALVIGDSPFLPIGEGFIYEPDLTRLPQAIETALSLPPASDEILVSYIAALRSEAFEIPMSLLWGNYESHPANQRRAGAAAITDAIVRFMNESMGEAGI